jgi:hypothetical protein
MKECHAVKVTRPLERIILAKVRKYIQASTNESMPTTQEKLRPDTIDSKVEHALYPAADARIGVCHTVIDQTFSARVKSCRIFKPKTMTYKEAERKLGLIMRPSSDDLNIWRFDLVSRMHSESGVRL